MERRFVRTYRGHDFLRGDHQEWLAIWSTMGAREREEFVVHEKQLKDFSRYESARAGDDPGAATRFGLFITEFTAAEKQVMAARHSKKTRDRLFALLET